MSIWQRRLRHGKKVAKLLTQLTTYENQLPQGAPTSAALANLALFDAEGLLLRQIAYHEITITTTRFIDDLTFSGRAGNEETLIATVIGVFKAYGFEINRKKLKENGIQRRGNPQSVCGTSVSGDHPSIGKDYVKHLRAAVFQFEQAPPEVQRNEIASLEGKARRVMSFKRGPGSKLLERVLAVRHALEIEERTG